LDGTEILPSEQIIARQRINATLALLEIESKTTCAVKLLQRQNGQVDFTKHCPEARLQAYKDTLAQKEKEEQDDEKSKMFEKPPDPIKEAHKILNRMECEGLNGEIPKQRNLSKLEFKMEEDSEGNVRFIIEAPKYLDTSEIKVDIHPKWFQVMIKGQSLLLHIPEEIKPSESRVRRVLSTGWLELIMPKLEWKRTKMYKINNKIADKQKETLTLVDLNILKKQDEQIKISKTNNPMNCLKSLDVDFNIDEVPDLE